MLPFAEWSGQGQALWPKTLPQSVRRGNIVKIYPDAGEPMAGNSTQLTPKVVTKPKVERPRLYKVILLNDDYTPRDFVTMVLKAVFRMSEDAGRRIMITAHQKGSCVVTVCPRDVAETKAKEATDLGKEAGFPLMFTAEPEE